MKTKSTNLADGRYYTVQQAAKRLKISDSLVRRWVREERFPSVRAGGKLHLIPAGPLDAFAKMPRRRGPKPL